MRKFEVGDRVRRAFGPRRGARGTVTRSVYECGGCDSQHIIVEWDDGYHEPRKDFYNHYELKLSGVLDAIADAVNGTE